jgi:hypothetical protein
MKAIRKIIDQYDKQPIKADRRFYIRYRLQQSKVESMRYLLNKVAKRIRLKLKIKT